MVTTAVALVSRHSAAGSTAHGANGHGPIEDRPAALAPVANRPLLLHVIDSLERAGIEDVLLAVDATLAPAVARLTARAIRPRLAQVEFEELTLAGALGEAARLFGPAPLLVHFADCLSHDLERQVADAAPGDHDALLLVEERAQGAGVISLNGEFAALPGLGPVGGTWAPAGVGVFGASVGEAARSLGVAVHHDLELVALAQRLAAQDGNLEARSVDGWLRLQGRPGVLLEANRIALERLTRDVPPQALVAGSDAQGNVSIHPSARLHSSVVRGPAVIGAGARLTDAYVGPYSSIGSGVVIDGAEVENSIVLTGARICHIGDRLEGSVIGPHARVFRDFRLPNALRLQVGEGAVVSVH